MSEDDVAPSGAITFSLPGALARLPLPPTAKWPDGLFDEEVLASGAISFSIFAPRGIDRQTAHDLDEVYIVAAGSACVHIEGQPQRRAELGDLIYVPAGVDHRFTQIDDCFATWVVFFQGPARRP